MLFPEGISLICNYERDQYMAYKVELRRPHLYAIILEEYPEGVYVNVLYGEEPNAGGEDWLYSNLEEALDFCERIYGIPRDQWQIVPDPHWHG
jgi:hypothetical protein